MWIYLASDGNHGSARPREQFKHVKGNQEPLRPKAAWLKSSRVGFFLRVCAGRRDAFFSNWSACRCALSAFVRFSDMRIVSHRSWTLGYTWGRASLRLICCGMRDALVDRKHEFKRLLLRVPASAPLRYADHVEAAGVEQSTSYKVRNRSYSQMAGHE